MKFKQSIKINQPTSEVFGYVSNFRKASLWSSSILTFQPVENGVVVPGVGYSYKNVVKFLDRQLELTFQIIEYQACRIITLKTTGGLLPALISYSFEPLGESTLLTCQEEIELLNLFKPFERVIYNNLERQLALDLATLKDWLESQLYSLL